MKTYEIPGVIPFTHKVLVIGDTTAEFDGIKLQFFRATWMKIGVTRTSVNGIPAGKTFKVAIGDGQQAIELVFPGALSTHKRAALFEDICQMLMERAADGVASNVVRTILNDGHYMLGPYKLDLEGIFLEKWSLMPFKRKEFHKFPWTSLKFNHENGHLIVRPETGENYRTYLSLWDVENACLFELIAKTILFYCRAEQRVAAAESMPKRAAMRKKPRMNEWWCQSDGQVDP